MEVPVGRWGLVGWAVLVAGCPAWRTGGGAPVDEIAVDGIGAPVSVRTDPGGTVHVRAATDADALFALGWAHARHRLAAIDRARRLAFGDTAARIGPDGVPYDTFARALDLRGHAERTLLEAGPEERTLLVAYADGVNAAVAGMAAGSGPERRAGRGFTPFTPVDVLGILALEAMRGSGNLAVELAALEMRSLAPPVLDDLLRVDGPPLDPGWTALRRIPTAPLSPDFSAWAQVWALRPPAAAAFADGTRLAAQRGGIASPAPGGIGTAEPEALLVDVRGRTIRMAGASIPGIPAVWIGRGDAVAWALLPAHADAFDLVAVRPNGDRTVHVHGADRVLGRPEARIEVQGGEPVAAAPPVTPIGPLVTGLDAERALALRWAGAEGGHRTLPALWDLARSPDVEAALDALDAPLVGAWRAVLADGGGTVADAVVGRVVRRRGVSGRVPHDGTGPDDTWQGWADRLPRRVHDGPVATIGERPDRPVADVIGTGFPGGWRLARLRDRARAGTTVREAWPILGDTVAGDPRPGVSRAAPRTPAGRACRAVLEAWDGDATDGAGAVVWAALREGLVEAALEDLAPDVQAAWRRSAPRDADPPRRGPPDDVGAILDRVCTALVPILGDDPAAWRWHRVHRGPNGAGVSGTGTSIFATGWRMDAPDWRADEIPGVRIALDLADGTTWARADVAADDTPLDLFDPRGRTTRLVPR